MVVAIQEIRSQDDYLIPNFIKLINSNGRITITSSAHG